MRFYGSDGLCSSPAGSGMGFGSSSVPGEREGRNGTLDDELLDDLPPLDGGEGEDESAAEHDSENSLDETDLGLDDKDLGDDAIDPADYGIAEIGDGWTDDAAGFDDRASDFTARRPGDEEIDTREASWTEDEAHEEKDDFGVDMSGEPNETSDGGGLSASLDRGEEGPRADDDPLREEDLPALDADDEGDVDESTLVDADFLKEAEAASIRKKRTLRPIGAPPRIGAVRAMAIGGTGLFVATSRDLLRIDLEGACEKIDWNSPEDDDEVLSIACTASRVFLVTRAGFLVRGTKTTPFEVCSGWEEAARDGEKRARAAGLVASGDLVWLHTDRGTLLVSADAGDSWERVQLASLPARARAVAVGSDGTENGALFVSEAGGLLGVLRRSLAGKTEFVAPPELGPLGTEVAVSVHGAHVACAGHGHVWLTRDGESWHRIDGIGAVTAMVWRDDVLFCVVGRTNQAELDEPSLENVAWVVTIDGSHSPAISATLTRDPTEFGARSPDDDARTQAPPSILHDGAHGVIWVSGSFGVVALEADFGESVGGVAFPSEGTMPPRSH